MVHISKLPSSVSSLTLVGRSIEAATPISSDFFSLLGSTILSSVTLFYFHHDMLPPKMPHIRCKSLKFELCTLGPKFHHFSSPNIRSIQLIRCRLDPEFLSQFIPKSHVLDKFAFQRFHSPSSHSHSLISFFPKATQCIISPGVCSSEQILEIFQRIGASIKYLWLSRLQLNDRPSIRPSIDHLIPSILSLCPNLKFLKLQLHGIQFPNSFFSLLNDQYPSLYKSLCQCTCPTHIIDSLQNRRQTHSTSAFFHVFPCRNTSTLGP